MATTPGRCGVLTRDRWWGGVGKQGMVSSQQTMPWGGQTGESPGGSGRGPSHGAAQRANLGGSKRWVGLKEGAAFF